MAKTVADLTKEVDELHPLLGILFSKMPQIQRVDYTHGPGEMGADFVLMKSHEVLGTTEYVGVIAKVGKISQDYSDVERQIRECNVPRPVFGGREKVRLHEMWVVTTGHITKGAQEKIYEEFRNSKIYFIDGQQLQVFVDRFVPNFWTDLPLELGEHLGTVRSLNAELDARLNLIPTPDRFYINQDIYTYEPLNTKLVVSVQRRCSAAWEMRRGWA